MVRNKARGLEIGTRRDLRWGGTMSWCDTFV